jgi:hypothetical protein
VLHPLRQLSVKSLRVACRSATTQNARLRQAQNGLQARHHTDSGKKSK